MADSFEFVGELMNFTDAELECRRRGFDGLAVISSPEEFNFAITASIELRKLWGLWVGLRFDLDLQKMQWDDGTEPASNMPGLSEIGRSSIKCIRINIKGFLGKQKCHAERYAICGNRTRTFKEASGITHKFKKPFNISSTLEVHHVHSYLECTILCSSQYLCNAAWFDAPSLTCNLVRADGYTGLENSQNAQTFVREGYIGYTE
ncbi:hypothetical protein RRG08_008602 [Elysia crispata]|uniref:C-type lectin domain-containing protein n=1 Tax=Elysia crispata TaxID=231223 RepID=A0AAE1B932_9GAST|nr:hypothetical protein RRG08_008602 [Elysia crispata]